MILLLNIGAIAALTRRPRLTPIAVRYAGPKFDLSILTAPLGDIDILTTRNISAAAAMARNRRRPVGESNYRGDVSHLGGVRLWWPSSRRRDSARRVYACRALGSISRMHVDAVHLICMYILPKKRASRPMKCNACEKARSMRPK